MAHIIELTDEEVEAGRAFVVAKQYDEAAVREHFAAVDRGEFRGFEDDLAYSESINAYLLASDKFTKACGGDLDKKAVVEWYIQHNGLLT